MTMATLFIDRREALIEAESGSLIVRSGDGGLWRTPLAPLERVVLRGPARISTGAIAAITGAGCGLIVLSGRRSEPAGTLIGRPHADAAIRLGLFRLALDDKARRRIAALIVRHKLIGQARLLRVALAQRPDRRLPLRRGLEALAEPSTAACCRDLVAGAARGPRGGRSGSLFPGLCDALSDVAWLCPA